MEEPPINDDEFDALWEKAAAEAKARQKPARRSQIEPSERRKPRADSFPAISPMGRPKFRSPTTRRVTEGGDHRPKMGVDAARRNTTMVRSLPLQLTEPASGSRSPKLERMGSKEKREPPRGRMMRRHSSIEVEDIEPIHSSRRASRRSSELTPSDEFLEGSISQISFSNLPELTDLMKKPTIGTAATAASDYSSTKQMASKNWSDETDGESGHNTSGDLKKKIAVDDAQRRVADYILNLPPQNGSTTPQLSLPTIHSISSFKENKDQLSGLVISRDAGSEVLVRKIQPASIFTNTPLKQGHEILTINDRRVKCPSRATTIIKSIKGEVNLLVSEGDKPPGAKYVKAKMEKQGRSESIAESVSVKSFSERELGLTLEESRHGLVRVAKIDEDSVFAGMPVREDDIVLAVNGESAQSADVVMTSLGQFHRRGGVSILLLYSMVDLRMGLLDRIVQSPWEVHWDTNLKGATISKRPASGEDHSVTFSAVFENDWSCDLIPSDIASPSEKEEITLAIDKLNVAISYAVRCWSDAVQISKKDLFTAAC